MRFSTSLCTRARMTWTQSLTPASSTDWLPSGMPASCQAVHGPRHLGRDLVGMVEVDVDPERVISREHVAELVIDALRQEDGHAGADDG